MSSAARRARVGTGHVLAWVAYGLAAGALATAALTSDAPATDALRHQGASVSLAVCAASALAAAALGLCARAAPLAPRALRLAAAALAAAAAAVGGALALLGEPPHALVAAALGLGAGVHAAAVRAEAAARPALAPRVRPAPTLLAAAVGAALVAAAALLPGDGTAVALLAAAALQLAVVLLAARSSGPRIATQASDPGLARRTGVRSRGAERAALLAILAIAAAGAAALAALRPALSAIGADDPQPAVALAITLAIGALLGPPLAVLAERLPGSAGPTLATVGGAAALVAPIARPGALDLVAATILGIALGASVALAELARRSGGRLRDGALALLVLAGAAGAAIAALLLAAVPLPDVVLGAAIACLVAGVGAWAPGVVGADAARDRSD